MLCQDTINIMRRLEDRIIALEEKVAEQAAEIARIKETHEKVCGNPYPGTKYSPPAYCVDHIDNRQAAATVYSKYMTQYMSLMHNMKCV